MGKVTVNLWDSDEARSVKVQSDGKIVLAGFTGTSGSGTDFAVIRLNTDGTLDTAFGEAGKAVVDVGGHYDAAYSMALQSDGKIIIAGTSNDASGYADFSLIRLGADGALDATFGTGGKAIIDIDGYDIGYSVALQSDGKIVLAGRSFNANPNFSVIRLDSDGALDTSFSTGGKAVFDLSAADYGYALAIQADGKILIAGRSNGAGPAIGFSIIRLSADGTMDASFNGDGKALIGAFDFGYSIALQADGKILVAGDSVDNHGASDFGIIRLNADGSLDTAFGTSGKTICGIGSYDDNAQAIALQADGKILVAGYTRNSGVDFAVIRLNVDGTLDDTFGTDAKTTIDIDGEDYAYSMALQGDGKIILAGNSVNASTNRSNFSVVRLNANGTADATFADGAIDLTGGSGSDPSLNQTHTATSLQPTVFGLATAIIILPEPVTAHRATSLRGTTFGAATATSLLVSQATSLQSTSFGVARHVAIATLAEPLESTQFGEAAYLPAPQRHAATSLQSTQFGQALHTSTASASSIESTVFGQALHTAITAAPSIESTTFGMASLTTIHRLLPSMAGAIFGKPTAHRGITC